MGNKEFGSDDDEYEPVEKRKRIYNDPNIENSDDENVYDLGTFIRVHGVAKTYSKHFKCGGNFKNFLC